MNNDEKQSDGGGKMIPVDAASENLGNERVLLPEDAVSFCFESYLVDVLYEA